LVTLKVIAQLILFTEVQTYRKIRTKNYIQWKIVPLSRWSHYGIGLWHWTQNVA